MSAFRSFESFTSINIMPFGQPTWKSQILDLESRNYSALALKECLLF